MERELVKAVVGFRGEIPELLENDPAQKRLPVATGNWGCGAFHGSP